MKCNTNHRNLPLVSIIMAAYNAAKTITAAVQSVQAQSYKNWELIVVNDCSSDSTLSILASLAASDPRIHLIHNEINRGVSFTRKRALDAVQGEWVAILDSDDLWKEDKLEKQLSVAAFQGADLVFTGSAFIDSDSNPIAWQLHVPKELRYHQLLKQNLISNSSVLVKTDLFRQHYAVGDKMHEDFAVWLNITKTGRTAYGIDEPLLIYRIAKNSKSGNKLKAAKMNWNTYRYVGLNVFAASYYMGWYTVKSIIKYRHLI